MKLRIKLFVGLLFFTNYFSFGQINDYTYKRELKGISEQWHKIKLPKEVFGKTTQGLTDIRIIGVTSDNDTIEAPYILQKNNEKITNKEVVFKIINTTFDDKGHYFTFEIPSSESINQIKLDFKNKNFDWRIKLEGSQNQNEWFTIKENYRILSIQNSETNFQFNTLKFANAKYRYFRIQIDSKEKPELALASIQQQEITEGSFQNYTIQKFEKKQNKPNKQTELYIEFKTPVPVSHIKIDVKDSFDFYRAVSIDYLSDSFKTEKGWQYNYNSLSTGTLNSIEKNVFQCNSTTVQKLKIVIDNQDNQPLNIDSVHVKGYEHELIARFTKDAFYFLIYGNKKASSPNYDLNKFTEKIPVNLNSLEIGEEISIDKKKEQGQEPLFKNKIWLWLIMAVIIIVLGWFTLKMMNSK